MHGPCFRSRRSTAKAAKPADLCKLQDALDTLAPPPPLKVTSPDDHFPDDTEDTDHPGLRKRLIRIAMNTTRIADARRLVIKVGSALVTNNGEGLDLNAITEWARQIAQLRQNGKEVLLVSSGAIACGMQRLGWAKRPKNVHELQACAAVGQMGLVQVYESAFSRHGLHTAQILLTHDDLADRKRYLNARSTLTTLLGLGVVPIINENDTVITDEIKFGDNDTLGALVANLVEADALIILTDQKGFTPPTRARTRRRRSLAKQRLASPALESDGGWCRHLASARAA
jgi:glutamate 5-kinase